MNTRRFYIRPGRCALAALISCSTLPLMTRAARGQPTAVINAPPTILGDNESIGSDTQLNVCDGGAVGNNFSAGLGSTITVEAGGVVGSNLEAVGADVTILGGSVGGYVDAFTGSDVTIRGGYVGDFFQAHSGSHVTISGGSVGDSFRAHAGSQVTISGGSVGDSFQAEAGSQVTISGGEFRLDGVPVEGLENVGATLPFEIPAGSLFSGVLADGTPFAFSFQDAVLYSRDADDFARGTLTLKSHRLPPVGPTLITASADPVPLGIRQGQTLVVDAGGIVGDDFNAGLGSTITIEEGGTVGRNLEVVGAEVMISGGTVGQFFDAAGGSQVAISGGSIGWFFEAFADSVVVISGGTVGGYFVASGGSQVTISGGSIDGPLMAYGGSRVNLVGTEFFIDGATVTSLTVGDPFQVTDRDVTLTGHLRDGSAFSFDLNSRFFRGDYFPPDAILSVTLVPEPSSVVLAIVAALICGYRRRARKGLWG